MRIIIDDTGVAVDGKESLNKTEVLSVILNAYLLLQDDFIKTHPIDCMTCPAYHQQVRLRKMLLDEAALASREN